ncbi:hypothetical protein FQZ97_1053950 [compost metagenome]
MIHLYVRPAFQIEGHGTVICRIHQPGVPLVVGVPVPAVASLFEAVAQPAVICSIEKERPLKLAAQRLCIEVKIPGFFLVYPA